MRTSRLWILVLCVAVAANLIGGAWAQMVLPREVRERILQAVVQLAPYDAGANRFVGTAGSGTVVSPEGFVLTNFHVVGDSDTGRAYEWHGVFTTDPRAPDREPAFSYWARFVAGDPRHDLAVVQIVEDREERPLPAGFTFVSMPVGDSNTLIPGDPITVVGYPSISGSTITFTSGIVSGFLGEDLTAGGKQWIKTDAKLGRGNSGGAAFDENGVLVGIPTLRFTVMEEGYVEQQDYLRPVALALPLLTAHVRSLDRRGGLGGQVADTTPAAPGTALVERGTLGVGDGTLSSGEYFAVHQVEAQAGRPVTVELGSSEFDVYLIVLGPDGERVLEVDDTPGHGSDVAETFVPAASGPHTLVVTSFAPGETGAYLLRVDGVAPADATAAGVSADVALLAVRGRLAPGGVTLDGGEYVDVYTVTLTPGTPVWFELSSSEFDVYLVVLGPDYEVVLEVDDSLGHGLDVFASLTPTVPGDYLVAVTSAFAGETGAYELTVREGEPVAAGPVVGSGTPPAVGSGSGMVGALGLGQQAQGQLAGAGDLVAFHTYYVEVPSGTAVLTVEMEADADLDLFLKYGGEIVSLADDGDWDYRDIELAHHAAFTVQAPRPGRWYVDVVWYGGGNATARYTLRAH